MFSLFHVVQYRFRYVFYKSGFRGKMPENGSGSDLSSGNARIRPRSGAPPDARSRVTPPFSVERSTVMIPSFAIY